MCVCVFYADIDISVVHKTSHTPENKVGSCGIMARRLRSDNKLISEISTPSMEMKPLQKRGEGRIAIRTSTQSYTNTYNSQIRSEHTHAPISFQESEQCQHYRRLS